jgi:hypothetical protein
MYKKDADGVAMLIAAIDRAATYEQLERVKALTSAGLTWVNATDADSERAAWRVIEEAAGWVGKFNPAD